MGADVLCDGLATRGTVFKQPWRKTSLARAALTPLCISCICLAWTSGWEAQRPPRDSVQGVLSSRGIAMRTHMEFLYLTVLGAVIFYHLGWFPQFKGMIKISGSTV